MKLTLQLAALLVLAVFARAQNTDDNDVCQDILIQSIESSNLSETAWLEYVRRIDETTFNQKKKDASFVGKMTAMFEGIPFEMSSDAKYSDFAEARRRYIDSIDYKGDSRRTYDVFRSYLPDKAIDAWEKCMASKGLYGFRIVERGVTDSLVSLEIVWIHPPGAPDPLTEFSATVIGGRSSNFEAPSGQLFPKSYSMRQGRHAVTVVREANSDLSVSLNAGGFASAAYTLAAPNALSIAAAQPLGAIVPSMLPPDRYADATGDRSRFHAKSAKWVPAGGRRVEGSRYAELISSAVPDLRGLFLRGLNQFEPGVPARADGLEDPNGVGRRAGDTQIDELKSHAHKFNGYVGAYKAWGGNSEQRLGTNQGLTSEPAGGAETRPKNVAIYYYIRIN